MATVYGVNRTLLNTPIGSNVIGTGLNKAVEYSIYDEYEASSLAANDIIQVGDIIPNGAVVTKIDLVFDDLGSGTTASVGDSTTVARYISGTDTATAAGSASFPNATCIDGMGYKIGTNSGDGQIQIKNLGSTATGTIKIFIKYSL